MSWSPSIGFAVPMWICDNNLIQWNAHSETEFGYYSIPFHGIANCDLIIKLHENILKCYRGQHRYFIFCESIFIIIVFFSLSFHEKEKNKATIFNFRIIRLHENVNPIMISNVLYAAVCSAASLLCALIRIIGSINYNDRRIFISFSFAIQSDYELWQWRR